eukprot:3142399-Prymnesium_polylepis.3
MTCRHHPPPERNPCCPSMQKPVAASVQGSSYSWLSSQAVRSASRQTVPAGPSAAASGLMPAPRLPPTGRNLQACRRSARGSPRHLHLPSGQSAESAHRRSCGSRALLPEPPTAAEHGAVARNLRRP